MTEQQFIDILEQSMRGEIPEAEVMSNIQYYRDYIRSGKSGKSEQEILQELGDPRLIARTICDTYQMNHKGQNFHRTNSYEYTDASPETSSESKYDNVRVKNLSARKAKLILIGIVVAAFLILFLVLGAIFWVSGVVLKVFARYILPVILILMVIGWIRSKIRD